MFPCHDIIMSGDDDDEDEDDGDGDGDYDDGDDDRDGDGDDDNDDGYNDDNDGEEEEDYDNGNNKIYGFNLSEFAMIEHQQSKPYRQWWTTETQQLSLVHCICVHVIVYWSLWYVVHCVIFPNLKQRIINQWLYVKEWKRHNFIADSLQLCRSC